MFHPKNAHLIWFLVDRSCLALELLGRDGNSDGLSGIKVLLAPVTARNSSLRDEGASWAIVGKEGGDSGERATVGTLDDDVGTARVELTVALVVVPDPIEDGGTRGGVGGDGHIDSVGAAGGGVGQAVAELILDDLVDRRSGSGKRERDDWAKETLDNFVTDRHDCDVWVSCPFRCDQLRCTLTTQVLPLSYDRAHWQLHSIIRSRTR